MTTRFIKTTLALALTAALIPCVQAATDPAKPVDGGAPFGESDQWADAANSAHYKRMVDLVQKEAIVGHAYALTESLGRYGKVLHKNGWVFQGVSTPNEIPNSARSVVYINASDAAASTGALTEFMASFQGVIIVDSDWVQDDSWAEKASAMYPDADTNAARGVIPIASLFYARLGFETGATPTATAIVRSSHPRETFPVRIDAEGLINGMTDDQFVDAIDLRITVAGNMLRGVELAEAMAKRDHYDKGAFDTPEDEIVSVFGQQDGWIAAGRYRFWAWKNLSGNKYVEAEIVTGDNYTTCIVNNSYKCGVYPVNRGNVVKTITHSNTARDTISWATAFSASFKTPQGVEFLQGQPSAAAWTATEAVNTDSSTVVWSEGFSLGANVGWSSAQTFSLGLSGAFSKSTVHTKRYDSWNGRDDWGKDSSGNLFYWSGISLKSERDIADSVWPGATDTEYNFETSFRGELLAGKTNICGRSNSNHLKPRSSFEGWSPSAAVLFRVQPASFWGANYVALTGALSWHRAKHQWTYGEPIYNAGYNEWRLMYNDVTWYKMCQWVPTSEIAAYRVEQQFTIWNGGTAGVDYFNLVR